MAVTVTDVDTGVAIPIVGGVAGLKQVHKIVTMDASYVATGGEPLTAAQLGLTTVLFAVVEPKGGYVFSYDIAAAKITAYWVDTSVDGAAMAEVVATTDLSTIAPRIMAIGT